MIFIQRPLARSLLALAALGSLGVLREAHAVGTDAATNITNTATVNYSVGAVAQAPISASASFLVDRRIDFTVSEVNGAATSVNPNQPNQATTFTVANTGNATQEFRLTGANRPNGDTLFGQTDNGDVEEPPRVFLDDGDGVFDAGDTQVSFVSVAEDATVTVHVVANIPAGLANGTYANVRLTAAAAQAGTSGATLEVETAGPDTAAVDVVFADGTAGGNVGRDGQGFAHDQYAVVAAALTVTKTSDVISDPVNGVSADAKAIPGAVIEYVLTLANAAGAGAPAASISLSDPVPANTSFATGAFGGAGQDISVSANGGPVSYCTAAADADDCSVAAGTLTVGATTLGSIAAGGNVVVRFRVTIAN